MSKNIIGVAKSAIAMKSDWERCTAIAEKSLEAALGHREKERISSNNESCVRPAEER